MTAFRGSRLHILDWVESAGFRSDLKDVAQPFGFEISDNALVLPLGHSDPREARLESFLPHPYEPELGRNLKRWWVSTGRGNTPNWDLAARATVGGRPALVLMEAKANVPELSHTGKPPHDTGNKDSQANYNSIASALSSAKPAFPLLIRRFNLIRPLTISWPTGLRFLGSWPHWEFRYCWST